MKQVGLEMPHMRFKFLGQMIMKFGTTKNWDYKLLDKNKQEPA